uniref:Uncharacterized protein n=1 Tax=Arundo donax TaxID=35708 RepID=A0A0A9C5F7_ARUDO
MLKFRCKWSELTKYEFQILKYGKLDLKLKN